MRLRVRTLRPDQIRALTGLAGNQFGELVVRLWRTCPDRHRGRPWRLSFPDRVLLTATALRTNLTLRELAVLFDLSHEGVRRVLDRLTPATAALLPVPRQIDRREGWALDGTLIPTRDHTTAGKAKNYRFSTNLQVLARRGDLHIVSVGGGGPGNRNDPVHYRGSVCQQLARAHGRVLADGGYRGCGELVTPRFDGRHIVRDAVWRSHRRRRARVEHAIARLKDWRVLRDHRRRGHHLLDTARAVAALHNLRLEVAA